jgi:hypothetical protein
MKLNQAWADAMQGFFDSLSTATKNAIPGFRRLHHVLAEAMGRKPFYRKRRTRSIRGK